LETDFKKSLLSSSIMFLFVLVSISFSRCGQGLKVLEESENPVTEEGNQAPILDSLDNKSIEVGELVVFEISAIDP